VNIKGISITVVSIILGVILAIQYKSIHINSQNQKNQNVRLEDLKDEIISEQRNNDSLREKIQELEEQRRQYERDMGNRGLIEENLKRELQIARLVSGLTNVTGRGIVITLTGPVTDGDILSVINELRASEAQAISVNGHRIIATSEVRKGGNFIVVNGEQIARPYEIKAIGEPDNLVNALNMVGGVTETLSFYNIRYTIEKKEELYISKVDSRVIKTNYLQESE
jgi:uncharacterized protein YlxW (UPF0749 family)